MNTLHTALTNAVTEAHKETDVRKRHIDFRMELHAIADGVGGWQGAALNRLLSSTFVSYREPVDCRELEASFTILVWELRREFGVRIER